MTKRRRRCGLRLLQCDSHLCGRKFDSTPKDAETSEKTWLSLQLGADSSKGSFSVFATINITSLPVYTLDKVSREDPEDLNWDNVKFANTPEMILVSARMVNIQIAA